MDFQKMAQDITHALGGIENITSATHCATRFRVTLNDYEKVDKTNLEAIEGVAGSIKVGSEFHVIIGKEVNDLYDTFISMYDIKNDEKNKKGFSIKNIFANIGTYVQAAIGPALMPMAGAAIIKAVLTLLSFAGMIDATNETYTFLWSASDAFMYFIPVMLAYGASKKLGCNQVVAIFLALMTFNTTYVGNVGSGTAMSLFGINVPLYSYANNFLPILLEVYIYSLIEKTLKKYIPDIVQIILVPSISIFIMIILTFLVIGPFMVWLTDIITVPTQMIAEHIIIAVPLFAMLWPVLTLLGLHGAAFWVITSIYFTTFGYDPVCLPSYLCTHMALGSIALTSALLSKDDEERNIGFTSCITVWIACISEPAIFGVAIKDKKNFLALTCGELVSGIFAAVAGIKCFSYGGYAYLLGLPFFIGPSSTIVVVILTVVIAIVATAFFLVLFKKILPERI